ncbi:MAG: TMEM165/GDT1 family protein [Acidobacteria bacterium]|nr:TMEM165/GDT1 family protein [Acidobacteriota bacterium]
MKSLAIVFVSIFLAELGDKTQLATLLFATDKSAGKVGIFVAASAALVASTLLAVIAGEFLTRVVEPATLQKVAGVGFILVGVWTLYSASQ